MPKFVVEPHTIPGKLYGRSKLQKLVYKSYLFFKILKMREKILLHPRTFLVIVFFVQREGAHK